MRISLQNFIRFEEIVNYFANTFLQNPCVGLGCLLLSGSQTSTPCIGSHCGYSSSQSTIQFIPCIDGNCATALCSDPSCLTLLQPIYIASTNPYYYNNHATLYGPCYGSNCATRSPSPPYPPSSLADPARSISNSCIPGTPGCTSTGNWEFCSSLIIYNGNCRAIMVISLKVVS